MAIFNGYVCLPEGIIYIYTIHIQLYHIHMYGTSILEPPKDNISMFESGQQGKNRMV